MKDKQREDPMHKICCSHFASSHPYRRNPHFLPEITIFIMLFIKYNAFLDTPLLRKSNYFINAKETESIVCVLHSSSGKCKWTKVSWKDLELRTSLEFLRNNYVPGTVLISKNFHTPCSHSIIVHLAGFSIRLFAVQTVIT